MSAKAQAAHTQWSQISRLLTLFVALAFPSVFYYFDRLHNWSIVHTGIVAFIVCVVFRAALDFGLRKFMPPPTLFGVDDPEARKEDVVVRRRYWFWKFWAKLGFIYMLLVLLVAHKHHHAVGSEAINLAPNLLHHITNPTFFLQGIQVIFLFAANFLIFMGPLIAMGVGQIKAYEPGDASWGVKLDDVRGQKEAKEEIRRVVEIWQSGENFEKYGGKRERGMLFLGPPGVGKTFLAKAIATGFNAPFVTIPGSGFAQAQPLDAKVLTPTGWATMGELSVGDEVVDPDGGTATVIGVFPQGDRDVYRVTFSDGSSTECDIDHLWEVQTRRGRTWRVKPLHEIIGFLARVKRQSRPYIPIVSPWIELGRSDPADLPLDPYVLGALLGDGSFTAGHVSFHTADTEMVHRLNASLPSGVRLTKGAGDYAYYVSQVERKSRGLLGGSGQSTNPVTAVLRDLSLQGLCSYDKFVPDRYKFADHDTRVDVLRGLMDTDGSADKKGGAVFTTTSERLAEDVLFLVQSLGGAARIRRIAPLVPDDRKHSCYQLQLALPVGLNPFGLSRKAARWHRQWEPSRRIVSVEQTGEKKPMQCIMLDSENELYVTDDMIVTHNTFIGIDAVIVRLLARRAKKMARKWGGQCIVFIDEIDAVGRARSGVGGGQVLGPGGMFGGGGMGMGQMALNQLLVVMDSIDSPPFFRMFWTKKINLVLDAVYFIPRKVSIPWPDWSDV